MIGFFFHAVAFVLVMALLTVINLLIGPPYWVRVVFFGWGLGLFIHWWAAVR
jgi:hypothetical protein